MKREQAFCPSCAEQHPIAPPGLVGYVLAEIATDDSRVLAFGNSLPGAVNVAVHFDKNRVEIFVGRVTC